MPKKKVKRNSTAQELRMLGKDKKFLRDLESGVGMFFGILEMAQKIKAMPKRPEVIDIDYEEVKPEQKLL